MSGSSSSSDRKGGGAVIAILIAVALIVVAWILSIVIRFALSRRREYPRRCRRGGTDQKSRCDDHGAAQNREPRRAARAPSGVMEMCIDNPRRASPISFRVIRLIDERTQALVEFAGGHDPGPLTNADVQKLASLDGKIGRAAP